MVKAKHKRKLLLNHPGLVIYDDLYLKKFIETNNIKDENLLEHFNKNHELGDKALSEGVIIPIYSIESAFYDIHITINQPSQINRFETLLNCKNIPFKVISGTIELTTILAIVFWENDNFEDHDKPDDVGDAFCINIPTGNYSVDVFGFYDPPTETKGFEFLFTSTEKLPIYKHQLENQDFNISI